MATARARHILVDTIELASDLKNQIALDDNFAELAEKHSKCPSKSNGGDLGMFSPGQMVPTFDAVCFKGKVGDVHVVQTQFGWHVVQVLERIE